LAETETQDGFRDDLDKTLADTLTDALRASDSTGGNPTKGERLQRHRQRILELRAKDRKRFTWEKIAEMLTAAGLQVSARTVRLEMTKGEPSKKKGVKASGNGRSVRLGVTKRPALGGIKLANAEAKTEAEPVAKPPTGDGFYKAEEVDN
jgi:hypothetical protein